MNKKLFFCMSLYFFSHIYANDPVEHNNEEQAEVVQEQQPHDEPEVGRIEQLDEFFIALARSLVIFL